jgi:hypothetical protein
MESAFMGWGKDHNIGSKFANNIYKGDVILIARRHNKEPEVLGFGVATDQFEWYSEGVGTEFKFDSMRKLAPFRPQSREVKSVPFMSALGQTKALAQLHPDRNPDHKTLCEWMERELESELERRSKPKKEQLDPRLETLDFQDESEYQVRSEREVIIAKRQECKLINEYIAWLKRQGRELHIAKYGNLRCDAFEKERNNLIEAKQSSKRENIRMAAGQLLDYAFQGRNLFADPHLAILLPDKPVEIETQFGWLKKHNIHLIWKEMDVFLDNNDGQFT